MDVADDGYYWERIRAKSYYNNLWTPDHTNGTEPRLSLIHIWSLYGLDIVLAVILLGRFPLDEDLSLIHILKFSSSWTCKIIFAFRLLL